MTYPFIAFGLLIVFLLYVLYLLLIKRDMKTLKQVMIPGAFFIVIWVLLYLYLTKS